VPVAARARLAAMLGLFAVLFIAIGVVSATGAGATSAPAFAAAAFVVATLLGLMAWGVRHSIAIDRAERRLDRAIEAAVASNGADMCGCGHQHDPDELHVTDCGRDGTGAACAHDCANCVLAGYRSPSSP
jgi:hypothetical protein